MPAVTHTQCITKKDLEDNKKRFLQQEKMKIAKLKIIKSQGILYLENSMQGRH